MKRLTQLVVLVLAPMFVLVGCGGGDATDNPDAATPGEVVQQFAEAMGDGDAETLKELMPDIEAKLGENIFVLAAKMAASAEAVGGVESVTIDNETVKDGKAKVTATLANGNGSSSTETFDLVKQDDGTWVITLDDAGVTQPVAEPEPEDDAEAETEAEAEPEE